MAGIYIHIPFCKQACYYCDFHFSTSLKLKEPLLEALKKEIILRKHEITEPIETIYFGGGTPSILNTDEIKVLLEKIYSDYNVMNDAEITLEANPDDLTNNKIKELRTTSVNRFSIGVQSFFNEDLEYMNRAHNADEAERAIKASQDAGFENITMDLIYGTPTLTDERWLENIRKSVSLLVPHISAYALTVEEKTPLASLIQKNKRASVDDEKIASQFYLLANELGSAGFEQYEISNFAKQGFRSRHNSSYWHAKPYLGIGPGAHSFDGNKKRRWNISNNPLYIRGINENEKYFDEEILSVDNLFNEYLMTHLRLQEGVSLDHVELQFNSDYKNVIIKAIGVWKKEDYLLKNNRLILTPSGKLVSDRLASSLFVV